VLVKNDKITVKELADRAFMSESTAARCLEAWRACVAELIEVGRLLDPVKAAAKKAAPKPKPATGETPPGSCRDAAGLAHRRVEVKRGPPRGAPFSWDVARGDARGIAGRGRWREEAGWVEVGFLLLLLGQNLGQNPSNELAENGGIP
jgi:hypothetical protein